MKAIRFWLEFAKQVLTAYDETAKEMGYSPFKATPKKTKVDDNKPTVN
jgi:hypothetical protein